MLHKKFFYNDYKFYLSKMKQNKYSIKRFKKVKNFSTNPIYQKLFAT